MSCVLPPLFCDASIFEVFVFNWDPYLGDICFAIAIYFSSIDHLSTFRLLPVF